MRSAAKDVPQTRAELLAWVEQDPALRSILDEARKAEHGDAAHDLSHLFRVALFTMRFAGPDTDPRECVAAALLHDHINVPKNHPDRARASEFSAEAAAPILAKAGFAPAAIARVQNAIRDHSFSRGAIPTEALGRALQDADRLEAIGAIGLMRVFSTGARMGAGYFHAEDPWAKARPLDDSAFSIDHFFTKLLKLPATFLTPGGRAEAEKRGRRLRAFLEDIADEIGEPLP